MFLGIPICCVPSHVSDDQIDEYIKETLNRRKQDDGDSLTFFIEIEQPLCLPTSS